MTEDPLTALQQYFEEEYGEIDVGIRKKKRKRSRFEVEPQVEILSESEEWQGIQTVENSQSIVEPQIISFIETTDVTVDEAMPSKSFMSSKTPKTASIRKPSRTAPTVSSEDEEAQNIQHDIALQRLLRESNLLSEHASREDPGRLRHLTLDSRITHLGGKEIPKGNVPLRIRKGIEAAKVKRQEKSEREAQEAGILMPVKRKSKPLKTRERGLKTTSGVGKFKNGMLKINEREIRKVNNSGSGLGRRGKSVKKLFK